MEIFIDEWHVYVASSHTNLYDVAYLRMENSQKTRRIREKFTATLEGLVKR